MAWELLPVDYTDAVWSGLKKYNQINNPDGTVSFSDVTEYSNREKSFFGALQANRMDEALNTLMSMVENGSDLYAAFQNYFAQQKEKFESAANNKSNEFDSYTDEIESKYESDMDTYKAQQQAIFNAWFSAIRDQLGQDEAGKLQNQITDNYNRLRVIEEMVANNDYYVPLEIDGDVLADDNGAMILADWKYHEL